MLVAYCVFVRVCEGGDDAGWRVKCALRVVALSHYCLSWVLVTYTRILSNAHTWYLTAMRAVFRNLSCSFMFPLHFLFLAVPHCTRAGRAREAHQGRRPLALSDSRGTRWHHHNVCCCGKGRRTLTRVSCCFGVRCAAKMVCVSSGPIRIWLFIRTIAGCESHLLWPCVQW